MQTRGTLKLCVKSNRSKFTAIEYLLRQLLLKISAKKWNGSCSVSTVPLRTTSTLFSWLLLCKINPLHYAIVKMLSCESVNACLVLCSLQTTWTPCYGKRGLWLLFLQ